MKDKIPDFSSGWLAKRDILNNKQSFVLNIESPFTSGGSSDKKQAYCFPTLIEKSVFYLKWVGDHLDKVFGTFSKKVR
jgi:hypothetical protein